MSSRARRVNAAAAVTPFSWGGTESPPPPPEVTYESAAESVAMRDAHLAALLRHNGVRTLFTRDRDFRRFAFLDVRDPLA